MQVEAAEVRTKLEKGKEKERADERKEATEVARLDSQEGRDGAKEVVQLDKRDAEDMRRSRDYTRKSADERQRMEDHLDSNVPPSSVEKEGRGKPTKRVKFDKTQDRSKEEERHGKEERRKPSSSSSRRYGAGESAQERRLRHAVEDGRPDKVELCLLEGGMDPNVELKRERATPLHLAAAKGRRSVVEVLLRLGAAVDPLDKDRITPLHDAANRGHAECVQLLLDAQADVNHRDVDGCTALHKAANGGHAECVELLLQHGAKIDSADNEGSTPLHRAACERRGGAVQILLERGASLVARDLHGQNVVHKAAIAHNLSIIKVLHEKKAALDAEAGDEETISFFISKGANIFKKSRGLWTAPHFAANEGHADMLLLLLLAGVPMAEPERFGRTPLHIAVEARTFACASFLLQVGENPLLEDKFGRSPLRLAKKDPEMWRLFESQRLEKMKALEDDRLVRQQYSRNMFSEFFGDLFYHTFAVLASFVPFFPFTFRSASKSRYPPARDDRGLEEGHGVNHSEERYFEELYFRLLREEMDEARAGRGDHLSVRFVLLRTPQSLTVAAVKELLFRKYGLTPEKVRLCAITDLPPAAASGSSEEQFDAEVRELPDSKTLRDCSGLEATSTLYLDYVML